MFHAQIPNDIFKRGIWMNLSIDVHSFMDIFKGFFKYCRVYFQIFGLDYTWIQLQTKEDIFYEESYYLITFR